MVYLVSAETGESRALTRPPSNDLGDYEPAFTHDGGALVFLRSPKFSQGTTYLLRLDRNLAVRGEPETLPGGNLRPQSMAWANGGRDIVFVSFVEGAVFRMPLAGANPPVKIEMLGTNVNSAAVSKDGRRLVYSVGTTDSNIWRLDLTAKDAAPESLIASTQRDVFPQYSPDGRRIAFYSNRSGTYQIWTCDADGSRAVAITSMNRSTTGSPRWSPDGRTIAFDSNVSGRYQVYTVSADGGKVKQVTSAETSHYAAGWSRDGRWIYFASNSGEAAQIWKAPSQGGEAVQVTRNGGTAATESPDGKTLYYSKSIGKGSLWKAPVTGGPETMIADSLYRSNFAVTEKGVYLTNGKSVDFLNPDTGARRTIIKTRQPDLGLGVSPDGGICSIRRLTRWAAI